ncbi:30S ribosomal protein S1 [Thermodesulfobacteriota bacterium]
MSDQFENENNDPEEESFADLFESYSAGMSDDLQLGDKISGKIISIGKDAVFLDIGTKVDGIVERAELLDSDGNLLFAEGDDVELYVVARDDHEIRLSKAISGIGGVEMLREAFQNAIPVEGKVQATCKGGFNVEILHRRAFCPISQMDVAYIETPEDYVGQGYEFLITQFEDNGKNIVVSRRKILAQAMEKEKASFLSTLKQDAVVEGRVTKLMPYGAFVELTPGLEGMVHVSELSWSRMEKPEQIVQADDRVLVKVIGITDGDKKNTKKISLSMKQVAEDPWNQVSEKFNPGDKVNGTVTRCMDFGVFVEIAPGIEGLVHISEMSYVKRVMNTAEEVTPGESVSVLIKDIDPRKRRISLSMRDTQGDPWLEVSDTFKVGQVVRGTLEHKEAFGYFVTLAPGITGLLPKSKFNLAEKPGHLEQLKPGESLSVSVAEIHPRDRKITLAPGDAAEESGWKDYSQNTKAEPMSDLALKLKALMESKK